MFLARMFNTRSTSAWNLGRSADGWSSGETIEHESLEDRPKLVPAMDGEPASQVAIPKPDALATPERPAPLAGMCSDAQRSTVMGSVDRKNIDKESRALALLAQRAPHDGNHVWAATDRELAVIFDVHASTVSRWRTKWSKAGLCTIHKEGRIKCMKATAKIRTRPSIHKPL